MIGIPRLSERALVGSISTTFIQTKLINLLRIKTFWGKIWRFLED